MLEFLGAIVAMGAFMLFALLYTAFSWGCVTYYFWTWFILPIFPQLPHLTFMQACGLYFFIGLFRMYDPNANKNEITNVSDKFAATITALAIPWFTLLLGYIFKTYVM